jgi:hypothetical protein
MHVGEVVIQISLPAHETATMEAFVPIGVLFIGLSSKQILQWHAPLGADAPPPGFPFPTPRRPRSRHAKGSWLE